MDSMTKLMGSSTCAFVQERIFLGQGFDLDNVFVFKMSEVGLGNGIDLVKCMQFGGDLHDAWIMFDHVKRVARWTTTMYHVYDSLYCDCIMTIAMCHMQSKDYAAQVLFWRNINSILEWYGVLKTQFKGFMASSAQTNWNVVRTVYASGDIDIPMEYRKRTCLLDWTQSMEKHTKIDI